MGTVFKNANVLTETGFRRCDILVKNGIILDMGNLQQEGVDLKGIVCDYDGAAHGLPGVPCKLGYVVVGEKVQHELVQIHKSTFFVLTAQYFFVYHTPRPVKIQGKWV